MLQNRSQDSGYIRKSFFLSVCVFLQFFPVYILDNSHLILLAYLSLMLLYVCSLENHYMLKIFQNGRIFQPVLCRIWGIFYLFSHPYLFFALLHIFCLAFFQTVCKIPAVNLAIFLCLLLLCLILFPF